MFTRTILKADKRIVQAGICQQRRGVTRRSVGDQGLFRLERINTDLIFGIDADQFIRAKLEELCRGFPGECKDNRYPSLAENIDLTTPKLSVTRADRKQGLDGIICKRADLRVYSTSSELYHQGHRSVTVRKEGKQPIGACGRQDIHHRGRTSPGPSLRTGPFEYQLACLAGIEP